MKVALQANTIHPLINQSVNQLNSKCHCQRWRWPCKQTQSINQNQSITQSHVNQPIIQSHVNQSIIHQSLNDGGQSHVNQIIHQPITQSHVNQPINQALIKRQSLAITVSKKLLFVFHRWTSNSWNSSTHTFHMTANPKDSVKNQSVSKEWVNQQWTNCKSNQWTNQWMSQAICYHCHYLHSCCNSNLTPNVSPPQNIKKKPSLKEGSSLVRGCFTWKCGEESMKMSFYNR